LGKIVQKNNHKQVSIPPLLLQIPDPPRQLFCLGSGIEDLLTKPRIAIVGSRKMSPYGKAVTEKLASGLAEQGIVIVSGLAYGVDACAHQAALEAGGQCIAVQANGLDQLYPAANQRLGEAILARGGVIVSEYPPGTPPYKNHFLERNRLVAGLADAVLITEAAERSGTLNTAAHALNQGKPVLVVPGNITNVLSAGTNNLLKAGATPVTSVDDVLSLLGIASTSQTMLPIAANPDELTLLTLIQQGTTDGGELLRQSAMTTATFNQTLTMLEITAKVRPLGGNNWAIA
jgi:DNA processing protein